MENQATYRNVTLSVRTPRFAVLIDKTSPYWHVYIEGIIQAFTQTWGGEYFLIIPTDGKTIDEKFWEILEAYNPDKIGQYVPTLLDLEEADPDRYQKTKANYENAWLANGGRDFEKYWRIDARQKKLGSPEISEELSEELKNRLAPFYFQDHIVGEYVRRGETLGFPFTHISDIIDYANDKPAKITLPRKLANKELQLLASSRTGAVTQKFVDEIKAKGIEDITCSPSVEDQDYVLMFEKGEENMRLQRAVSAALGSGSKPYPETDFLRHFPFTISMIELSKYYKVDAHRDWEESLVVVIGSQVTDYCLYYCLSRMHEGAYWLPDNFLKGANDKTNANEGRATEEREEFTGVEEFASSMVTAYFRKISYGHEQKHISIVSTSLNDEQLQERKLWMHNISLFSKVTLSGARSFLDSAAVTPLSELSVHCIWRVIETNNYTNQQDIVFQDGKSVSKLNTPKPKNFSYIDPTKHRWITSIEIEGYRPPVLPFLGQEIFGSLPATHDTRVAVDGLVYFCPSIGYFGGDIDVVTVRPTLRLVDENELFAQYFQYSGYDIELSDKGSYLKDTIERFGSLQATAEFFRAKQHRDLFDQYRYTTDTANDDVAFHLDTEKRAYLSLDAFSRTLGGSAKATALIDELTAKDILSRGFIFHCSRCRRSAWYGLGEVTKEFKCKRCDFVQPLSQKSWKLTEEPRWYYRLAETVSLFYETSSYLTALALDKLRQQSKEAFHYICESNIKNYPNQGDQKEIDILAISDGKLILGECKDCKPKAPDLDKYHWLQPKLKIKPDRFVLATTEATVSDGVKNKLAKIGHADVLLRGDLIEA